MKAIGAALICVLVVLVGTAQASTPQPPCTAVSVPGYPAPGAAPVISVWQGRELDQSKWRPSVCTGWPASSASKLVVALAGSFRFDGTIDRLLTRLMAISAMPTMQYWSTTEKEWRPLAYAASALSGPDATLRRPDFSAADVSTGAILYYWADDSRTGAVTSRLDVLESTPERAVISSENITPVKQFFFTLFKPGALQSTIFIQRLSPGIFGVYILSRTGEGTSILAAGHDKSYVNRAVALYRQLAGIKTDLEPPAAR